MDDLGKQFEDFYNKTGKALKKFPVLAANEAVNIFQDSFNRQAFIGETTEVWKKRKSDSKKSQGRAILIKTGRLKRGVKRFKADWDSIIVGNDVPYAGIHNDGFKGTESVRAFTRKLKARNVSRGKKKIASGVGFVKAHTRKMNMPRRRFIGNSPFLNKRIERVFITELNKL